MSNASSVAFYVTASTVVNFIRDVRTERLCVIITEVKCCSLYIYDLLIELPCMMHCAVSKHGVN